ncbi:putative nuclease HARBI1 [Merluccius polli]|uniref:Putative nuclease HARBI1 n=1 Tax=Merluccius polli TaxID=89951 RepID=A0AA47MDY0_MERPO|nr:putative nuclease HARBI1 [Merluccius polli]
MYCRVDATVSILRIWRDEGAELWQDFRLSIRAMNSLQRLLDRGQDHGWGNDLEVLIYTYWLAHGLSYQVVSSVQCTKGYCALSVIHRVAQSIWNNLSRVLSFPQAEELQAVGVGFADISGTPAFANVVGAIDGSHIWIKPPQLHCLDYLNYKNFYSINMQAIFDAKGKFLDIYVGYPGSVHDTRVMVGSPRPVVLERAFGMMKTRWRSTLFRALEVKPTFAPQVIASCAFLHNIMGTHWILMRTVMTLTPHPPQEQMGLNETLGNHIRDTLAAQVSGKT